ncbi:MAG: CHAT domain-containing protein [Flammeovirgaceae bacterium]
MVSLVFVGAAVNAQLTASSTFEKLMTNGQYAEALQETNEQLARMPPSQLVFWQNQKAQLQIILGAYNDAEATLNQIKPVDAFDEATTLSTKGFLQLNKGRFDLAVEALQHSWDKFQSAQRQSTREAAACLSSLSQVYRTLGKQNQALEFENRALQTRLQLFGENSEEVAASYSNLGVIYTLSDLDKALEMHEKAQDVYQKIHGENHPKLAITAVNIGIAHQRLKFYDDAISHFETAKKIWDQIYPNGHPNQAIVLRNLATTYGLLNDEQAALTYYQQALDVYKKAYGHKHPDLASTYNDMGRFHLNNRRYEEALQAYQQALLANAIVYSTTDAKANPSVKENFYNETVGLFSLHLKSLALEERHYGKTLKLEDLKDALSALYSCDSLIDNIRQHSTDEEDKLALGALANEVYEDGVRIAYTISEMVLTSPKYLQGAFYFAEKSKSAVLQESIADAQAKLYAGIPPDLLEQEKQLKSNIALLNQKLAQKPDDAEVKKLREDLFTVNGQYQQFVKNLEKNFPNYFNLKFSKSETTVADLQAALAPQAALVSYFLAERGKRVYQFILSQNKFKVTSRALPADYERYLKGLRNSLFHTSPTTFKKATRALAQALVPRVPSGITEVVIIPSGALSTVPFEALPLARVRGSEFDGVRYLISKLAVSYDFSASLFLQKKKMTKTRMAPSVFLCAPVVFDERQGLATLPGTQKEVASIANLFPQNARTVLYEEANESLVKSKELLHYSHLHFATHGVVDEESPASSRIFLSGSPNDDGNLYAGEIYNLNLNAELAVLSACETGLGKISKGEGVIGLSRALIYAGAKNIVVSFWTVADESTAELMTNFYKEVAAHPSQHFSRSLQVAKLKLIEEKTFSDPYHWAPFVLVGE